MNRRPLFAGLLVLASCLAIHAADSSAEVLEVRKIWDAAPHNAFTDLIRFNGQWLCTFREAAEHVNAADGKIRVIASKDGAKWESVALLQSKDGDLRDPKLCITPEGRLMMDAVLAIVEPKELHHRSMSFFSKDGAAWDGPFAKGDDNFWLWRSTWHEGKCYSVGYSTVGASTVRLYVSDDGRQFKTLRDRFLDDGEPNEASLLFRKDGTCLCLARREAPALLGTAAAPYDAWKSKTLNLRVGGPQLTELSDGRLVAAGRISAPKVQTALFWLDAEKGELTEFAKLPSGGDTSYPGLVWHEGVLWVSYYSSHEGKTSIYLAKVRLDNPK